MSSGIDAYLDELDAALTVNRRQRQRIVEEVRAHLMETADRHRSNGLGRVEAEAAAVETFGPVATIAEGFAPRPTLMQLGSTIGLHGLLLGAVALITVGVSGAIAGSIGVMLGPDLISGSAPPDLDAAACARLAATEPGASGCTDAWSWHYLEESVLYRALPGILGVLVGLGTLWTARQHLPRTGWARRTSQLSALAGAIGFTTLCALASVATIGLEPAGLPQGASQTTGWWLSWVLGTAAAAITSVVGYAAPRRGLTLAD